MNERQSSNTGLVIVVACLLVIFFCLVPLGVGFFGLAFFAYESQELSPNLEPPPPIMLDESDQSLPPISSEAIPLESPRPLEPPTTGEDLE